MQKIEVKKEKKVVNSLDKIEIDRLCVNVNNYLKNNSLSTKDGNYHLIVIDNQAKQVGSLNSCNDFLNHNTYKEAYFIFNKGFLKNQGYADEGVVRRWVDFLSETFNCFEVFDNIEHEVYKDFIFVKVNTDKFITGSYSRLESKIVTFALRAPFRGYDDKTKKVRKEYLELCLEIKAKYPNIETFECLQLAGCLLKYDSNLCVDYYFNGNTQFSNISNGRLVSESMMPSSRLQSTELLKKKLLIFKNNPNKSVKDFFHYPTEVSCERIIKLYNEGSILEVLYLLRDSKLHKNRNNGLSKNKDVYVANGIYNCTLEEWKNKYNSTSAIVQTGVILGFNEGSSYTVIVGFEKKPNKCHYSGLFNYPTMNTVILDKLKAKYGDRYKDYHQINYQNLALVYPKQIIK